MIVSYSEVSKFQTCPRQYYYGFTLGRTPVEESDALATGNKGHKLLQYFFEYIRAGKTKDEAVDLVTHKAKEMMRADITDSALLKAWVLVNNYIRETDFTSEAILIENRFILPASRLTTDPFFEDVQIGFTPDLVVERPGKKIDVEDAKFVGRAWSKSKMNRFSQTKLYHIFLSRMGYDVSRSLIRFFNTQTAKISIQTYTLGVQEEVILIRDFLAGVRDVVEYRNKTDAQKELTPRTMNYSTCQYCAFEFPCSLEAEGKDASKTLDSQYMTRKYDYNA